MAETIAGALLYRAVVEDKPQVVAENGEPLSVTVSVHYLHKKNSFLVKRKKKERDFDTLMSLRAGDEMYVSYDGEDIGDVKHNPWWKRVWLCADF